MSTTTTPHCKYGHALSRRTDGRMRCRTCDTRGRHAERGRHPRETLLKVSNEPLRERFLSMRQGGDTTAKMIARHLEWFRPPSPSMVRRGHTGLQPDTGRVLKALGVSLTSDPTGKNHRKRIAYETAAEIARVLGMDPHEAGV